MSNEIHRWTNQEHKTNTECLSNIKVSCYWFFPSDSVIWPVVTAAQPLHQHQLSKASAIIVWIGFFLYVEKMSVIKIHSRWCWCDSLMCDYGHVHGPWSSSYWIICRQKSLSPSFIHALARPRSLTRLLALFITISHKIKSGLWLSWSPTVLRCPRRPPWVPYITTHCYAPAPPSPWAALEAIHICRDQSVLLVHSLSRRQTGGQQKQKENTRQCNTRWLCRNFTSHWHDWLIYCQYSSCSERVCPELIVRSTWNHMSLNVLSCFSHFLTNKCHFYSWRTECLSTLFCSAVWIR